MTIPAFARGGYIKYCLAVIEYILTLKFFAHS